MKKLFALLTVFAMLFAFASCKDSVSDEPQTYAEIITQENGEAVTDEAGEVVTEIVTVPETDGESDSESTALTTELMTDAPVSLPSTDISEWTDEEIVEFYKKAAIKSKTAVKSQQVMTLDSMVVNDGDGVLGTLVELATPIMKSALKSNSTEFDGITGGYEMLSVNDTESVKAYKSGEYIVIEMTMKEQTDGIHADRFDGTVGHAISVVGDISAVEEALPQFDIGFEESEIKLHYSDPELKVKINKNGIIEKGTWTYNVNVTVKNLHVAGRRLPLEATVENAHGAVGYIITVGGGF